MNPPLDLDLANKILQMSPSGVMVFDDDGRLEWANQTMCEFLTVRLDNLLKLSFTDICTRFLDGFSDHPDLWKVSNMASRQSRWLISLNYPDEKETKPNNVRYFVDVSEIMKLKTECRNLKDQLDNHSTADELTGLLNNRSLMQALEPQVSRSRRYNNPLSVIVVKITDFNTSTDTVIPVSDQVLTAVSFYLRDQMRWVDLVGRTDDNEFTLILPETEQEDALKLSQKINKRMESLSLPDTPDVTVAVNALFGVANWEKGDDTTMLLTRARENLVSDIGKEEVA